MMPPKLSGPEFLRRLRELAGSEQERRMVSTTVVARDLLHECAERLEDLSQELALAEDALRDARYDAQGEIHRLNERVEQHQQAIRHICGVSSPIIREALHALNGFEEVT